MKSNEARLLLWRYCGIVVIKGLRLLRDVGLLLNDGMSSHRH